MLLIGKPSISMGHLYHGYVSHNQRVPVFFHITKLLGICHLRLKEGITIYHPQKHPLQHEKISV